MEENVKECQHTVFSWHTPLRNHKICQNCGEVTQMTHAECWRNRESFEDPWTKLYEGPPSESI